MLPIAETSRIVAELGEINTVYKRLNLFCCWELKTVTMKFPFIYSAGLFLPLLPAVKGKVKQVEAQLLSMRILGI